MRIQKRAEFVDLGKAILQKAFRQEGYPFSEKALEGVLKIFEAEEVEDLYAQVGEGLQSDREVLHAIFPGLKQARPEAKVVQLARARGRVNKGKTDALPIRGLIPGMALHFARCCHPLPGDRIVGIVTTGKGVTIHTIDCESLEGLADTPERWIDVAWDTPADDPEKHVGRLTVTIAN